MLWYYIDELYNLISEGYMGTIIKKKIKGINYYYVTIHSRFDGTTNKAEL